MTDIAGTVDLFDTGVRHELVLTFTKGAYDRMVAAFQDSEEKEYVEADLTIDGTLLSSVGIRLKGNSTLRASVAGPVDQAGLAVPAEDPVLVAVPSAVPVAAVTSAVGSTALSFRSKALRSCPGWLASTTSSRAAITRAAKTSRCALPGKPARPSTRPLPCSSSALLGSQPSGRHMCR